MTVKKEPVPVTGSSMAVLLTQGLMANDPPKVDTVLQTMDLEVVKSTLEEINVIHVIPLLKALEHRLRTRSAQNIQCWIRWIQCTLAFHMSYLISQRDLTNTIGSLLEWMKSRAVHLQQLFELHGKISTLSDQIERRFNKTPSSNTFQPLIVFNDDQMDDTDVDEPESIGSEGSEGTNDEWWDEGDIKQNDEENEEEEDESDEDDNDEDKENQRPMENKDSEEDDNDVEMEDGSEMDE